MTVTETEVDTYITRHSIHIPELPAHSLGTWCQIVTGAEIVDATDGHHFGDCVCVCVCVLGE